MTAYYTSITLRFAIILLRKKELVVFFNCNVTLCVWYHVPKVSMPSGCQFMAFPCHAHLLFDGEFYYYSNYDYLCSLKTRVQVYKGNQSTKWPVVFTTLCLQQANMLLNNFKYHRTYSTDKHNVWHSYSLK